MILPADRCRQKSHTFYVAENLSEIGNILNPKVGDVALAIAPGALDAWILTESDHAVDGFQVVQSNQCEYIWQHAGEFVNVALFGATPNTGEDQTVYFDRAVEAAPEGFTLFVPPGEFILNDWQIDKDLSLYLADGATLKMASEATAPMIRWTVPATGAMYGLGTIDGNKEGQTQDIWYPVIKTYTETHFTVRDITFQNHTLAAIQDTLSTGMIEIASCKFLNASEHGGVTTTKASMSLYMACVGMKLQVHHCLFQQDEFPSEPGRGPGGMLIAGPEAATITDNIFVRIGQTFMDNHLAPIQFYQQCDSIIVSRNIILDPMWDAIVWQNSYRAIITNNQIRGDVATNSLCAVGIWFNPTQREQVEGPEVGIISGNIIHNLSQAVGIFAFAGVDDAAKVQVLDNYVTDTLHGIRVSGVGEGAVRWNGPVLISGNVVRPTTGYGVRVEAIRGEVNIVDNDVRAVSSHGLWALIALTECDLHLDGNYFSTETTGFYGATMRGLQSLHIHSGTFSNTDVGGVAYTVEQDASANPVDLCMINSDEIYVEAGTITVTLAQITAWTRSTITHSDDPNGNVQAPIGSRYVRTTGGAGTTFYVKEGALNNQWVGK